MKTKRVLVPITSNLARSALILTAVLAVATPAAAADMKGEYGARTVGSYPAVPVPAPIPIPDTFNWYVRGDAGYSLKSTGNVSVTGTPQIDVVGPGSHDGPFVGSIGMGRYVTPSLRVEFGIDVRNQQTIGRPKPYGFSTTAAGPLDAGANPTIDTNNYVADRRDNTTLESHTGMLNMYYDVKTGGMFTPYIGAGAGVSFAQMRRGFTESASCVGSTNSDTSAGGIDSTYIVTNPVTGATSRICSGTAQTYTPGGGHKGINSFGPALALMAGTSVELRPGVSLDAGYRLMWQGSTPSISMASIMGDFSKIAVGSRTDHELRMGLRWDIW